MILERGMNRYKPEQIAEDLANQKKSLNKISNILEVDSVNVKDEFSPWDYEFLKDNKLIAIGEYRRRFCYFRVYPDFQFSQHKFEKMMEKSKNDNVPAFMFVEFNDTFQFFKIDGTPKTKVMKRKHENRTEICVCIPNNNFLPIDKLKDEL